MASELLKTFKKIESGRKKCIDSLNSINIPTPEDATLDAIADYIKRAPGEVDPIKDQHMWVRPKEWINTEELLLNAPILEGYTPFCIYLLHARRPNTDVVLRALKLPSSATYSYIRDAYYMSDGTFITHTNTSSDTTITHTWDITKDIETGLGYKLRYIIVYANNSILAQQKTAWNYGRIIDYSIGQDLLEITALNPKPEYRNTMCVPKRDTKSLNLYRIHFLDCDLAISASGSPSDCANAIREIRLDKSGDLTIDNGYGCICRGQIYSNYDFSNIQLTLPNAKKITMGSSSSNDYMCCRYAYMPKAEELLQLKSGSTNYNNLYVTDITAPRLHTFTHQISGPLELYNSLPSVKNEQNLRVHSYWGMDKFYYKKDTIENELIPYQSRAIYNDTVERLTNTTVMSGYIVSIILPKVTKIDLEQIFTSSSAKYITELILGEGFKSSLNISETHLPTLNILELINKLADVTNEAGVYTLTLGTLANYMTEDELKIATDKGWVIK